MMFDRKLYKTEIEIDDDEHFIVMRLYAPQYEYNCINFTVYGSLLFL